MEGRKRNVRCNNTFTVHRVEWMSCKILFLYTGVGTFLKAEKNENKKINAGMFNVFTKSLFSIPNVAEYSVFFFLFNDRVPFELAAPNSTGKTILTALVWGTYDANVVSQERHWTDCMETHYIVIFTKTFVFEKIFFQKKLHPTFVIEQ